MPSQLRYAARPMKVVFQLKKNAEKNADKEAGGELEFLVFDHGKVAPWWEHPKSSPWDILTYYDRSQPQYTHLRASMLVYAHINLFSMLSRFTRDKEVRVATDSIYVRKSALKRLEGVEAFIPIKMGLQGVRSLFARGGVPCRGRPRPMA